MIRKTAPLATALLVAASSLAIAQSQAPTQSPTPSTSPPPAAGAPPAAKTPSGETIWYTLQPDAMRATKLIGADVVNTADETVGDVNEIVLGKDGRVAAVIIGVGGFLGIGAREVAVSFDSVRTLRDQNNNLKLVVNATKDTLKAAPEWKWDTTKK
jgi:sporulation protein YlmC with PRC-barrel domain